MGGIFRAPIRHSIYNITWLLTLNVSDLCRSASLSWTRHRAGCPLSSGMPPPASWSSRTADPVQTHSVQCLHWASIYSSMSKHLAWDALTSLDRGCI